MKTCFVLRARAPFDETMLPRRPGSNGAMLNPQRSRQALKGGSPLRMGTIAHGEGHGMIRHDEQKGATAHRLGGGRQRPFSTENPGGFRNIRSAFPNGSPKFCLRTLFAPQARGVVEAPSGRDDGPQGSTLAWAWGPRVKSGWPEAGSDEESPGAPAEMSDARPGRSEWGHVPDTPDDRSPPPYERTP